MKADERCKAIMRRFRTKHGYESDTTYDRLQKLHVRAVTENC
jgi:hypothetical protein